MRSLPRRFALAFVTLAAPCVLENASFHDASGDACSLSGSDCAFGLTSDCAFGDWPKLARFFLAWLLGSPQSFALDEGLHFSYQ